MKCASACLLLVSLVASSVSFASGWDGYNNPSNISRSYNYTFSALPLSGKLSNEKLPWSDTYFPSFRGGIAYRWQTGETGWNYSLYTQQQLSTMSAEQIAKLSPAEKYDIFMGRYDYPTVNAERRRVSPKAQEWEGLCHGWVPASLLHAEPTPKTATNPNGIEVRFGSSDIKALIIYYYGVLAWKPSGWIGKRCNGAGGRGCRGVNAGTLHVVLANQIGLMNRGFVADVDRGKEVWNQAVFAFNSQVIGQGRNSLVINTKMTYSDELDRSQWEPHLNSRGAVFETANYQYELELNSAGRIVGGDWRSRTRPGFLWQHDRVSFSNPYYGKIASLLNDPTSVSTFVETDSALSSESLRAIVDEATSPEAL